LHILLPYDSISLNILMSDSQGDSYATAKNVYCRLKNTS
jgi:hypothetical protein